MQISNTKIVNKIIKNKTRKQKIIEVAIHEIFQQPLLNKEFEK